MQVVYEYDPATGQHVPTELPEGFIAATAQPPRRSTPLLVPPQRQTRPTGWLLPSVPPATLATAQASAGRRLSETGKAKLHRLIVEAKSWQELSDIEQALNAGHLKADVAAKLRLQEEDFVPERSTPSLPLPIAVPDNEVPIGALGLSPLGLLKLREAIQAAPNHDHLTVLDKALASGDIVALTELLDLQPEDLQEAPKADDDADADSTQPPSIAPDAAELGRMLDEVTEDVAQSGPPQLVADKGTKREALAQDIPVAPEPPEEDGQADDIEPEQSGPLGGLLGDYKEPTKAEQAAKRRKTEVKTLPWPPAWAWLASRTQRHEDFRPPPLELDSKWAQAVDDAEPGSEPPSIVGISTSLVYVGSATEGYDPHALGRLVLVDIAGKVLLDTTIRPSSHLLDTRPHLTGLDKDALLKETALTFDEARDKLMSLLRPQSLLVGYRINTDLQALKMWHGPMVDVSLLFAVESTKKNQYHPLRYLGEHVLFEPEGDPKRPHDALENARLIMRLALHEVGQPEVAAAFPPKAGPFDELVVRHIPIAWGEQANNRVAKLFPTCLPGSIVVTWLLSETDPTEWRGDATVSFSSKAARDKAFDALKGLTDINVQWDDPEGAPPLGTFINEHILIQAFRAFGPVAAARIPRRPNTGEPQNFAFVSYLEAKDASKAIKSRSVNVEVSPTWTVAVKAKTAKSGQANDKRVAIQAGDGLMHDWLHVVRR
mmetsp:Transcript_4932/g.8644  ORF Transcript_4932/g.8644 Transcript_4932/m.8644 type:complete len:716 (+) Transcript_4932:116-2263(+)